jgi:ribose transport system substrate-binding protein
MLNRRSVLAGATLALGLTFAGQALAEGPEIVSGPGYMPECFAPWDADTKYFKWPKKEGPFRMALVNGFVGNDWRIQMVKTAKLYAESEEMKAKLKEFKVVSTGTDAAVQLGAIEDFINQGFDAIVTIAVSPEGFDRVIKLADRKGVVLVPFDNILDTDKVMMVNEDQYAMGVRSGEFLVKNIGTKGKLLEIRGLPGNSVDRDRHEGFRSVVEGEGKEFEVIEVVGNWDIGTSQQVTADALAVHGSFDGVFTQGGSNGTVQALMDANHPFVPMAGEGENGFRKQMAMYGDKGLKGWSYLQSPALVAISMKAAVAALEGNVMPQLISVPIPAVDNSELKESVNYWEGLPDNVYAASGFPPCGVAIDVSAAMKQTVE